MLDFNKSHFGAKVMLKPQRPALSNIFQQTPIESTNQYKGFTKQMMVYGITFIARENISDDFMLQVAETLKKMFPRKPGMNLELQEEVLQNIYRYNGLIPFIHYDDLENIEEELDSSILVYENSVPDIIIQGSKTQANEVFEHLLHFITAIGLHITIPETWAADRPSVAMKMMKEAIEMKNYDVSKYEEMDEHIGEREVILLQEYVYWLITSIWNLQERYGLGEDEWLLKNKNAVKEKHFKSYELFEGTIPAIMESPGYHDLDKYGC